MMKKGHRMKRHILAAMVFGLITQFPLPSAHSENTTPESPWETYGISGGVFISDLNTSFRIGTGVGVDIDVEKLLGLDSTNTVFRIGGLWRFSDNQRHRVDLSWFAFHRSGTRTVDQQIEFENNEGETITIDAGTEVEAFFDIDIYQLAYSYSFLQDKRIDLAGILGLYIMPINFGIEVAGVVDAEGEQNFTAPLPTLGFRLDVALTPKWYFRSGTQLFYLEYEQFKGSLLAALTAVEYRPWTHVGLGLGADSFKLRAEADGEDYPAIDLEGKLEFHYFGLQAYLRLFF
jgi:hypothetical protein